MFAPRDKLWSAPAHVVDTALQLLELTSDDTLVDYGCGDAVALFAAAKKYKCKAVGYEIHAERVDMIRLRLLTEEAETRDRIHVHCMNALEAPAGEATAVYLYLISRGLSMILPQLQAAAAHRPEGFLRVVSVLYKIPGLVPIRTVKVYDPERSDVMHPVHLYHITATATAAAT